MSDIKPCPFCGKEVDLNDDDTLYPDGTYWKYDESLQFNIYEGRMTGMFDIGFNRMWQLVCNEIQGGCGVELHAHSKEECIEKWNKRV